MDLYLLRHGLAVERGTPGFERDATRPLTPKGRRKLRKVALAMQTMELEFDCVFTSPYARAAQTAKLVARLLGCEKLVRPLPELAPGGGARQVIGRLRRLKPAPSRVLVVGHEPDMGELVSVLVSGRPGAHVDFRKGGLASVSLDFSKGERPGTLAWLLTPAQMGLMT